MPDPISNQVAQQAANQASQQSAAQQQQPVEVDADTQAQFEDALNNNPETQQIDVNATDNVTKVADKDMSIGDAILDGIEKMKSSHDTRSQKIEEQLMPGADQHDMSVQDCVKLQFEVMQISMEQELTGKIADKTSQGVQTLFKNQ